MNTRDRAITASRATVFEAAYAAAFVAAFNDLSGDPQREVRAQSRAESIAYEALAAIERTAAEEA